MKRHPWLPMYANFQDDERLLEVSAEAELLYVRSIAKCKALQTEGIVTRGRLRQLCDKMTTDTDVLVAELVEQGLWLPVDGSWLVPAYESWNGDADRAADESSANGKRGNHKRWHHGPFETCTRCRPELLIAPDSPPDEQLKTSDPDRPPDRGSDRPDVSAGQSPSDRPPDRRPDQTRPDGDQSSSSTATPRPNDVEALDDDDPTAIATSALEDLGLDDPTPTPGESAGIAHALRNGWSRADVSARARRSAIADDPRAYFGRCLTEMVNSVPAVGGVVDLDFSLGIHPNTGLPIDDPDAEIAARYAEENAP